MSSDPSKGEEKVRLQVVLCSSVAKELERHAREMDRSQAWVVGWAISNSLGQLGIFGSWMVTRIKKPEKYQEWATGDSVRLQLKFSSEKMKRLEQMANAWNQSPVKLAGLFVHFAMESFAPSIGLLKTELGKNVRNWWQGPDEATKYDLDEANDTQAGEDQDN